MNNKLKNLIDFIEFTHEFRKIIRVARAPYSDRYENDSEHSFQLAMVAWYIIDADKLKLNKEKCLMYSLAHDLVEIYAGDTYIFDKRPDFIKSKEKRESKALLKIKKRFPEFNKLYKTIYNYGLKKDPESKFVYALDKLIPPIQIYLEKGKLWHDKDVSLSSLIEHKDSKIATSEAVDKYWIEVRNKLIKGKHKLFPKL